MALAACPGLGLGAAGMLALPFSLRFTIYSHLRGRSAFTFGTQLARISVSATFSNGRHGRGKGRRHKLPAWSPIKPEDVYVDAEWSSVFQTARPYDPYLIPLPLRMGRAEKGGVPPVAKGNLELMKIPNFFHLTPPAIQKHCEALKSLCTPWPTRLPHLPLKVETRNYVFPGHSVKHSGARKVTVKLRLKDLTLTDHARNKMITLAGSRYNTDTDTITIIGTRCPTRKQNYSYVMYLLKVLYLESTKVEPWEEQVER